MPGFGTWTSGRGGGRLGRGVQGSTVGGVRGGPAGGGGCSSGGIVSSSGRGGGRPMCSYFMRTGKCGFGDRCRFSHELPAIGGEREWSSIQVILFCRRHIPGWNTSVSKQDPSKSWSSFCSKNAAFRCAVGHTASRSRVVMA